MSNLRIDHGNPWWLSPNVWAVPTTDPNEASPGAVSPMVNSQYFLVANIRNTSAADVLNAQVYFWWADPSLGILTSTNAHLVGTSSVSVSASASNTCLTLASWTPSFVNDGHECLIAAVVEAGAAPPTVLDGNTDPTVAQRNLGVVTLGPHKKGRLTYPFQVCNPFRTPQRFSLHAERAPIEQVAHLIAAARGKHPGRAGTSTTQARTGNATNNDRPSAAVAATFGIVSGKVADLADYPSSRELVEEVHLAPSACTGFTLFGEVEGGDALIHVSQRVGDKVVGGLSVLVLHDIQGERT